MNLVFDEKYILLLVSLSTCIQSLFAQSCSENLTNIVAYEGDPASFTRVTNYQSVQWQYIHSYNGYAPLLNITNYDDVVASNLSSAYEVSNSELNIFSSSAVPRGSMPYPTAGLYISNYRNRDCTTAANLIVIRSGPLCFYNATDANSVTLYCSVDFAVSNVQTSSPVFNWINANSVVYHEVPTISQPDTYWKSSNSSFRIDRSDATTYECRMTFSPISRPFYYVTATAPNFTASCFITNPFVENCPAKLENIVAYEGNLASFKRLSTSQPVQWQFFSSNDKFRTLQNITDDYGVVDSMFTSGYTSTATDLIISSQVAPQAHLPYPTAGLYVLKYTKSSCVTAANLIVIRGGLRCFFDVSSYDPAYVTLFCGVEFAASFIQPNDPIWTWKNGTSVVPLQASVSGTDIFTYITSSGSQLQIDRNDVTRYECQLTFGPALQKPYGYVTTTPPNFTASAFVSTSDISINPTFGPVAGGTVVTITNNLASQNVSISVVYIGVNLTAEIYNSSGNTVLVKTPMIESEILINQPLPIILRISTLSSNTTTRKYFTYKPNPSIDDVRPRNLSITGGTSLTISGYSLDSVAYPLVRAAVIITNGSRITYYKESYGSCQQPTENGTKMICTSPPIYIRQDFLMYLFNQTIITTNVGERRRKRDSSFNYALQSEDKNILQSVTFSEVRSKRSVSVKSITTNQTYILPSSQEQMIIYLGMGLDDFKRYENNSLLDSNGNFDLKYPPNISCVSEIQYADFVTIQGNGFTQCCAKEDYTIRIGNGFCNVQDLTDNALTCNPPKDKPQQTEDDKLYPECGDNSVIFVDLKFQNWKCSCLKYPDGDATKLIIIIVATVGSTLVLIVAIAVILTILKRKQKTESLPYLELRSGQRSTLYAPQRDMTSNPQSENNIVEGTTENAGSAYYSSQIQAAYLELDPETSGQSNKKPIEGSDYLASSRRRISEC